MPPLSWHLTGFPLSWTSCLLAARTGAILLDSDWFSGHLRSGLSVRNVRLIEPPLAASACSPLLKMRQNETPFEQLPVVPPERLLPALLRLVRTGLPIQFRYLTHLTRLAIQHHLHPFMWLVHAYGEVVRGRRMEIRGGGVLPAGVLQHQ